MCGIVGMAGMKRRPSVSKRRKVRPPYGRMRCILALGGGSWPKLGSNGAWVPLLAGRSISIAPLRPANCGFDVGWTEHFPDQVRGASGENGGRGGEITDRRRDAPHGEFVITETGVEGGVIYAVASCLRDEIEATGRGTLRLDLAPDRELPRLIKDLSQPRGKRR